MGRKVRVAEFDSVRAWGFGNTIWQDLNPLIAIHSYTAALFFCFCSCLKDLGLSQCQYRTLHAKTLTELLENLKR